MTKVRYIGVLFPESEFNKLREAYTQLRKLQRNCRPSGPEYLVLAKAIDGLKEAATHFTKDPHFYGGRPH